MMPRRCKARRLRAQAASQEQSGAGRPEIGAGGPNGAWTRGHVLDALRPSAQGWPYWAEPDQCLFRNSEGVPVDSEGEERFPVFPPF